MPKFVTYLHPHTCSVLDLARQAGCPVLSTQGGGYKLPVTIATTIRHVAVLAQAD